MFCFSSREVRFLVYNLDGIKNFFVICAALILCVTVPYFESGEGEVSYKVSHRAAPDHLLLTEICVTPTAGEFIEIFNPTGAPVPLDDYYITDITDYYNIVNSAPGFTNQYSTDFVASFPPGSIIDPGEYQVIAVYSGNFITEYGIVPNYCLQGADCPRMNATLGFIGNSVNGMLTNIHETAVLFQWNGVTDLISDVDMVWWGDDDAYRVNKTGVSIDSEFDGDGTSDNYKTDASTYPLILNGPHNMGDSFKRSNISGEPEEVSSGGNGISGHDETTENLTASWNYSTPADPTVTNPLSAAPIIRFIEQEPAGNPTPGTNVEIIANVTDDGSLQYVNITISVNQGPFVTHSMNQAGGDNYSYTLSYNSPPMGNGVSVGYNISATDNDGNVTRSEDFFYYYLPDNPMTINITEVMFNHTTTENNWIELYCLDDGNPGIGNSLLGWSLNDLDGTNDKTFSNVIIKTGEPVLLHYNRTGVPDEMDSADGNGDGIIDSYCTGLNTRLDPLGDQIVLFNPKNHIYDAVCWSYNDILPSRYEQSDLNYTAGFGQWASNITGDCVDAEQVLEGYSISRNKGEADTNSKADWYPMDKPDPGIFYNFSDAFPVISDILMNPQPEGGILPSMYDVNITARITDDKGVHSANITWTLDGVPQSNIPMEDNGISPDETADDHNWTARIPGQPDGSAVVFSVVAFDAILQRRVSGSHSITYRSPTDAPDFLITEVMIKPAGGESWVEIHCVDDLNDGNGYLMTGWELDDMDGETDHLFNGTLVHSGEYIIVHYGNAIKESENSSSEGNADGIIDLYTATGTAIFGLDADQMVLFNHEGEAVDCVAWYSGGLEQNDMDDLFSWGMWDSKDEESPVDVSGIPAGFSLTRKFNQTTGDYYESNSANDWCWASSPTPGIGGHTQPPQFAFNGLGEYTVEADVEFTINWTMTGYTNLVNLSLYYYPDEVNPIISFIDYPDIMTQFYIWDTSELDIGKYYLQVRIDDTINPPFTVNSTHPLEIVRIITPPPIVIDTSPPDGAVNVDVSQDITISFNNEMEIGSFSAGDTFVIRPIMEGNISLYDLNTMKFTPQEPMEYNTSYRITVKDVRDRHGLELAEPYDFSFQTRELREYEVNGKVVPQNALLTVNGNNIEVDSVGYFHTTLPNGTYSLTAVLQGYEKYTAEITINGSDKDLGNIILILNSTDDDDIGPSDDDDQGNVTEETPEDSGMKGTLIVVIIVLIVMILGVVIAIILYVKKTGKEDDITPKTVEKADEYEAGSEPMGSGSSEEGGEVETPGTAMDNINVEKPNTDEVEESITTEPSAIENNNP